MTHDDHLREQMGLPTLHGVEHVLLDAVELVLHRADPTLLRQYDRRAWCGAVPERARAGLVTTLEPLAASLCSDCWPASDGPL